MYLKAVLYLLLEILCISINDVVIKSLSNTYALHQLVFVRAIVSLMIILPITLVWRDITILRTKKPGMHIFRGLFIVLVNLMFFAGLATLPLAEASAVVFIAQF